jgi:hypothetical protein
MATIATRSFNLIEDKYLALGNEEFVRTLAIGSSWTRLRVGLLVALTPDGTSDLQGVQLVWGLCSGKTNPFGAATTTNFLGSKWGTNAAGDTLTYNANSGNPYYWCGRSMMKKVGATKSVLNGVTTEFHRAATNTGSVQRRSLLLMEITKGSPNFTMTAWNLAATGVAKDFTPAHLLEALEQATSVVVNGETLGAGTSVSTAFDEGAGALDTVDVHWNKSAFPLEIYALATYRLA